MSKKSYIYLFIILLCVVAIATTRAVKTYNSYIEKQKAYVVADKEFMVGLHHENVEQPISQAQASIPKEQYQPPVESKSEPDLLDKKIDSEFNYIFEEIKNLDVLKDKDIANMTEQDRIELAQDPEFQELVMKYSKDPKFLEFLQTLDKNPNTDYDLQ